jgi:hypothetical protein
MNADRGCPHAEQVVALGLHALEPADEAAVLTHVPTCAACQDVLRDTEEVVLGLAATAEPHDPAARLRANLMQAVATTAQVPSERERPADPARPGPATPPSALVEGPHPRSAAARSRRHRLVAVAAVIALTVAGAGAVASEVVNRGPEQQTVAAAPPPDVARVLSDLDQAGARHALLRAANGKPVAAVVQYQGQRQVMPFDMAPNSVESTVYVLWGIGQGPPVALGTFDVDAPSEQMLPVGSTGQADQFPSYGISIENSRTAPVTPGLVVASGQVAS